MCRSYGRSRAQLYNRNRPHEALGQRPPAALYPPSPRPRPEPPAEPWYDAWHAVRRVRTDGSIKWGGELVFISETLTGETGGERIVFTLAANDSVTSACRRRAGARLRPAGVVRRAFPTDCRTQSGTGDIGRSGTLRRLLCQKDPRQRVPERREPDEDR